MLYIRSGSICGSPHVLTAENIIFLNILNEHCLCALLCLDIVALKYHYSASDIDKSKYLGMKWSGSFHWCRPSSISCRSFLPSIYIIHLFNMQSPVFNLQIHANTYYVIFHVSLLSLFEHNIEKEGSLKPRNTKMERHTFNKGNACHA